MNQFRPPKTTIRPYNPSAEQKEIGSIKNEIRPGNGPLNIPGAPATPRNNISQPNNFARLKAMFAKGK